MKFTKLLFTILICSFITATAFSQAQYNDVPLPDMKYNPNTYNPVDFHLQLKNMHLWRGLQVTSEAMAAVDLYYHTKDDVLKIGLWGGAGFSGGFREFDYYIALSYAGFSLQLWDIYNFSPGAEYNNRQVFQYEARKSGHFIDLSLAYRFPEAFPLNISWATVIFGRDRGALNEKNLYSTYLSGDYPIYRKGGVDLDLGMAAAFALDKERGSKANFYANNGGIVNINLTASKKIMLGRYVLPVTVLAMWNPAGNNANLQIALDIF